MKIVLINIAFLIIFGCHTNNNGVVQFKKADATEPTKQLLEIYLNNSNLNDRKYDIVLSKIADTLEIHSLIREEFIGDKTDMNYYVSFFMGYRVFFMMELDQSLFHYRGNVLRESIPLSEIEKHNNEDIPLTYDTPYWFLTITNNKIVDFGCQFCTSTETLTNKIESISF
jgi:hypothetical protein